MICDDLSCLIRNGQQQFFKTFVHLCGLQQISEKMIKLAFGTKKKIVKLDKGNFNTLRGLIKQSFPEVPTDYILSYLDQDKDEISLGSDEDLRLMLSTGAKINNVYIKQSLSQAIEITEQIEPSFEVYDSGIRKAQTEVKQEEFEDIFKKSDDKATEIFLSEKPKVEEKILGQEVPIYHSIEITEQRLAESKEIPVTLEEVKVQSVEIVEEVKKEQPQAKPKIQVVENEERQKSQNSKSFIISASEMNKVEIDQSVLHQKLESLVKKIIEQKKIIPKEKQVIENKQVLQNQEIKRAKIFEQRKNSPKKRVSEAELIYHGVICSNCKDEYGIIGVRYQCIYCDGFNICESCEAVVNHKHALLKVKRPEQVFKKDQIIQKYRREIHANVLPEGHYVPSISKEEANIFIETSRKMLNESMEKAQRMIGDMYLKMESSHKNPYEQHKPIEVAKETMREKMDHLINLFGIDEKEARYLCQIHRNYNKEQLAEAYIQKKTFRS